MPRHFFILLCFLISCLNGLHAFQLEKSSENNKFGVLDTANNEQILPNEYQSIGWGASEESITLDGVIRAKKNERWALFNTKGDRITENKFITLEPFEKGKFIASQRSQASILQLFGMINQKGKELIPFRYVRIEKDSDRLILTERGDTNYLQGLYDRSGKELIPLEYLDIHPLNDGYYAVEKEKDQLALFDSLGQQITTFEFQEVSALAPGFFEVSYYNRKGVIDESGKVIIPTIHKELELKDGRVASVGFQKWTLFKDSIQREFYFENTFQLGDSLFAVETNSDVGIINSQEEYILYFEDHSIDQSGKNLVSIENLGNQYKGVINSEGILILPVIYDEVILFDQYLLAKIDRTSEDDWFAYDLQGKRLNNSGYDTISTRLGDVTVAIKKGKKGIIGPSGIEETAFEYNSVTQGPPREFIVSTNTGQGVINRNGIWLITPYRDSIAFEEDHFSFTQGSALGFSDLSGTTLTRSYDTINYLPDGYYKKTQEGYQAYNFQDSLLFDRTYDTIYPINNKLWYLQREELKFFYRPEDERSFELPEAIDSLRTYHEGYIGFLKNSQWGFLDETGLLRIANRYEDVGYFSEALCPVKLIGKWGVISRSEELIVQPEYDSIRPFFNALSVACKSGKYGVIDRTGRTVLNLNYDNITRYTDWIALIQGDKIGISDIRGRLIKSPQYDEVTPIDSGHFLVRKGNKYGIIDLNGKDLVPLIFSQVKKANGSFLAMKQAESITYDLK